jgi:carbon monoxide dehydrogenase subunit G
MEFIGAQDVPAPQERVWNALNDPDILRVCIPGCESIDADGENVYRIALAAKVGPVSARFAGKMRMEDIDAPRACTLRFEGNGGVAGFVNGEARVSLSPAADESTTLSYVAKAHVGGKLAQVGSRLVDGAARKQTEEFFARFVEAVRPAVAATAVEAAPDVPAGDVAYATPSGAPVRRTLFIVVAVVAILAVAIATAFFR